MTEQDELLIIEKNRNGGIGSLPVYFDERRLQFYDRTTGIAREKGVPQSVPVLKGGAGQISKFWPSETAGRKDAQNRRKRKFYEGR